MNQSAKNGRLFWAGYCLLLLLAIGLGLRSERTVAEVVSTKRQPAISAGETPEQAMVDPKTMKRREDLLASALPGQRDPFRPPAVPKAKKPKRTVKTVPQPTYDSVKLRSLMYDESDPTVQLTIEGRTSHWLHEGDSFIGWTVVKISETSVRVAKGDRLFEIRAD